MSTQPAAAAVAPELTILTGMSGAGRSTAATLPGGPGLVRRRQPAAWPARRRWSSWPGTPRGRSADRGGRRRPRPVVLRRPAGHARPGSRRSRVDPRVVFLEASDEALVRRFESVRRKHPLQGDGRILDGIARERALLRGAARPRPTWSSTPRDLNVHELRVEVEKAFGGDGRPGAAGDRALLRLQVRPAGRRRHGASTCRFLPNPHWVPELRPLTGLDPAVADYVFESPEAAQLVQRYGEVLRLVLPGYAARGQAVPDPRGRVHRRQAPQRRHGRGVRPAAASRRRRRPRRPPRPGSRVSGG